jgi:hypothetical protein
MIKNYFKTAFRSLSRNRNYTIINISGLAVGISVCLIIFLIIQYHTSFDNFHSEKNRIYRVLTESHHADAGTTSYEKNVPFLMPGGLKTEFPQLQQVAPIYASHNDELQVLADNGAPVRNFKEQNGVFYTSPAFFKIFDFPLLAGSYESLKDPNHVLLTKEIAEKYFGDWTTAIGKTIKLTGYYSIGAALFQFPAVALKVSGILAPIPANTDFQLKLVVAYGTDFTGDEKYGFQQHDWNGTAADFGCYVLLPHGISVDNFNHQLATYAKKMAPADNTDSYIIQPLNMVHYDA